MSENTKTRFEAKLTTPLNMYKHSELPQARHRSVRETLHRMFIVHLKPSFTKSSEDYCFRIAQYEFNWKPMHIIFG